jgi:hypothetical protein
VTPSSDSHSLITNNIPISYKSVGNLRISVQVLLMSSYETLFIHSGAQMNKNIYSYVYFYINLSRFLDVLQNFDMSSSGSEVNV